MKRNALILGVVFSLLATACGAQATPTANPVDIQHTAEAAAFTMVAQTQESLPSVTPLPPTNTPIPTIVATNTPLPTLTPDSLGTALPTAAGITPAANIPTFTPQVSSESGGSGADPCNQALTAWEGPTANFTIVNETRPQGTIVLSMYVVPELGQCGYPVINGDRFSGPIGQYSAGAFITGRQNLKAFGGFRITEGNWKIAIDNESITARGGCYPNC